jgi:hypothetical protein
VGAVLPAAAPLYNVPTSPYDYTYINGQWVLVEPREADCLRRQVDVRSPKPNHAARDAGAYRPRADAAQHDAREPLEEARQHPALTLPTATQKPRGVGNFGTLSAYARFESIAGNAARSQPPLSQIKQRARAS